MVDGMERLIERGTAMTLGERLIAEIERRGRRGRFFDKRGYETLRSIDSVEVLRAFLDRQGYRRLVMSDDVGRLARGLEGLWPSPVDIPLVTLGVGAAMGVVAFALSMLLIPSQQASDHDLNLALVRNVGVVFLLLLGFCSGYVQQSLRAMLIGIGVGAVLSGLHRELCTYDSRIPLLVSPILLSGAAAFGMGRGAERWIQQAGVRFLKGAILGMGLLLAGALYFGIAHVDLARAIPLPLPQYRQMLWLSGPVGAAILGGFFLVFFHWAAGLKHLGWGPRINVRATYRDTEGLDRVSGNRRLVWKSIDTRLSQSDPNYARWHVRWCRLWLGPYLLFLAGMLNRFWLPQLVVLPPQLEHAISQLIFAGSIYPFIFLMEVAQASRQTWRNARVAEELQKYPDGIPPDEERQNSA